MIKMGLKLLQLFESNMFIYTMTTEIIVFERGVCLKWHYIKPKYFLPIDYALYTTSFQSRMTSY